jgi:hypothetical protein
LSLTSEAEGYDLLCVLSLQAARLQSGSPLLVPAISFADENGVSFWLPGLFGSLAAVPQQPGWAFTAINYFTPVTASGAVAAQVASGLSWKYPTKLGGLLGGGAEQLQCSSSYKRKCGLHNSAWARADGNGRRRSVFNR